MADQWLKIKHSNERETVRQPARRTPSQAMKDTTEYQDCAVRLKALADPGRLRIVEALFEQSRTVSDLAEALGESIVNVSHHLAILRRERILAATKNGRFVIYSIHPEVKLHKSKSSRRIELGCCRVDLAPLGSSLA